MLLIQTRSISRLKAGVGGYRATPMSPSLEVVFSVKLCSVLVMYLQ